MDLRALTDADRDASWELDADAFHVPDERRDFYQRHFVPERFVGVFDAGRLVAQTRSLPFGQFFGGRSVPMGGLASVAVAPDARGCGAATRVVHAALRAMRERGELISSLFPATTALYRKLGYEAAGATVWRGVAPRLLAALPEPAKGQVRRAGDEDLVAVRACYERVAPQLNGFVDRPDSWWRNLADVWAERSLYVAQGAAGEVEGYVVYRKVDGEYAAFGGPFQLAVENLVAETRDAALALWRLVGSWSSQAERVVYRGGAEDPLLLLLPEQELKPLVEIRWMTRVVDAAGAVGARGFPAGLAAEVHLSLRDEQLPENAGDWVLSVEGGRGHLSRGGRGTVHLGVGAFSSLYAGWAGCGILARAGLVEGAGAEERAALDAAFVGPTPWMLDEF